MAERALTALVGQAVLDISDEEYLNVDVIFQLVDMNASDVKERAVKLGDVLVMHPLDVLYSRLANLYALPEKQTEKGVFSRVNSSGVILPSEPNPPRAHQHCHTSS